MDACTVAQAFQTQRRGETWVQISVQLSLRVVVVRGVGTHREREKDPENS